MRKKLKILFDVDDVLVPFTKEICRLTSEKFGKEYRFSDVKWDFSNWGPLEIEYARTMFGNKDFIRSLPVIHGMKQVIDSVIDMGHEPIFCTSTMPGVMSDRASYLIEKFPNVDSKNIIMTGRKDMVKCDIHFDDNESHILYSGADVPVVVDRPWNQHIDEVRVTTDYPETFLDVVRLVEQGFNRFQILHMQKYKYESGSPHCIIVVGSSGSGKTTIVDKMLEKYSDSYSKVVSDTTRDPRSGEINGVNYHFRALEEFQRLKKEGHYIESSEYAGSMYGSSHEAVKTVIEQGKNPVFIMEIEGAKAVKGMYPNSTIVFIKRDKAELIKAILGRDIPDDVKCKRILQLEKDFEAEKYCDYTVENNSTIEDAASKIHDLSRS